MCYAKKLVGFYSSGSKIKLDPGFDGQFDCGKYNCGGCDQRLVDGEPPKRNQGFKINFNLYKLYF